MADQDKSSGGTGVSPAVVVEQTTNSRHKPPYRPTDKQDISELQHKHSKAPAVPSVAEELKASTVDTTVQENAEEKEQRRAKYNEMSKQNASKKLSMTKKQSSSPEAIALAHVEVDTKKGSITPPSQPIPHDVEALSGADFTAAEKEANRRGETDSITDEISDARTVDTSKKYSNWMTMKRLAGCRAVNRGRPASRASSANFSVAASPTKLRPKKISPRDELLVKEYKSSLKNNVCDTFAHCYVILAGHFRTLLLTPSLKTSLDSDGKSDVTRDEKCQEQDMLPEIKEISRAWILERRASVGPCFRPGMPFEGPTGISIYIPRKNFISKSKLNVKLEKSKQEIKECNENGLEQIETNCEPKLLASLREKLSSVHNKIKNALHC
ncbi:unnamed protein product [Leptosia nina]|uniref:Uncharacterized protein n=1 Tax=Leptosia nina TaxID=320188 RepID=A0AAV1K7F7_9NEOP